MRVRDDGEGARPGLTRRSMIKRGLFGGGLLLLGGAGFLAVRPSKKEPLPKEPLTSLSAAEYALVMALARRIVAPQPKPGSGMPSVEQVNVGVNVDAILARADEGVRRELRQLMGLFENGLAELLFAGAVAPFTQLSPEHQDQVLSGWRESRLVLKRTGYQALRTLVLAGYYASPMIWPAVGYEGPPQGFHDPNAPVWRGGGQPRPDGNGVWHEEKP